MDTFGVRGCRLCGNYNASLQIFFTYFSFLSDFEDPDMFTVSQGFGCCQNLVDVGGTWIRNSEGKPQMDGTAVRYPLFTLKSVNQL